MTSMQLQIIRPGGQVRRETFTQGPIAFGREADNQIIFSETYFSRKHGVFHQNDDGWYLENLSVNGTQINGKRIKKKHVPVNAGDIITVGDQEVFKVEALLNAAGSPTISPSIDTPAAKPAVATPSAGTRKTRLWLSLAGFWVVVLALLVFVQPLLVNKDDTGPIHRTVELKPEEIKQYVRRKPPEIAGNVTPDERRKNEALAEARDVAARLDARVDGHFKAYRAYQKALAYSGNVVLADSQDMRRFTVIEEELIQGVTTRYYDAYAKLRSQNYRDAEMALRDLNQYFPEPQNPLMKNVEAHRRDIGTKYKRRR